MSDNMNQKQIDRMIELMMAGKSEEEASKQAIEEIPSTEKAPVAPGM
jgi:flagellar biosynthesis regulator FlaF